METNIRDKLRKEHEKLMFYVASGGKIPFSKNKSSVDDFEYRVSSYEVDKELEGSSANDLGHNLASGLIKNPHLGIASNEHVIIYEKNKKLTDIKKSKLKDILFGTSFIFDPEGKTDFLASSRLILSKLEESGIVKVPKDYENSDLKILENYISEVKEMLKK